MSSQFWVNEPTILFKKDEINYLKTWISERLDWMDNNMVGTCDIVSTTNLENSFSLSVQPNPFSETIDFVFDGNDFENDFEIKIYDALGKEIRILNFYEKNKMQWDGKNTEGKTVAAGVYFYSFSNEKNQVKSGKIIKM